MSNQTTKAPGDLAEAGADLKGQPNDTTADDYEAQAAEADYKDELFSVWGCL